MKTELVIAATFAFPGEAEVASSMLDAAGIDSVVEKPFVAGVRPDWLFGRHRSDGVRLLVRTEDLEAAQELLSNLATPDDDE